MISSSLSVTIEGAVQSLHKNEESLFTKFNRLIFKSLTIIPNFLVKSILLPKIHEVTSMHAEVCLKFQQLSQQIESRESTDTIDDEMDVRDMLDSIKSSIKEAEITIHKAVKSFSEIKGSTNDTIGLVKASHTLISVLQETYAAATELQWAIAEHDASNVAHQKDKAFIASSSKEVGDILDKILHGA